MSDDALQNAAIRILRELVQLHRDGVDVGLLDRMIRETIFYLWEGGERQKWSWSRPHSAAARALHRQCLETGRNFRGSKAGPWRVTYEHAIPLRVLRSSILQSATEADLRELLETSVRGVVITADEDIRLGSRYRASMPPGSDLADPTARYRAVGIEFEAQDLELLPGSPATWPGSALASDEDPTISRPLAPKIERLDNRARSMLNDHRQHAKFLSASSGVRTCCDAICGVLGQFGFVLTSDARDGFTMTSADRGSIRIDPKVETLRVRIGRNPQVTPPRELMHDGRQPDWIVVSPHQTALVTEYLRRLFG